MQQELANNIMDLIYPINTGFIAYDDTDYSEHLGFEWEKTLIGRVPVGKDTSQTEFNTIGKTGGAKTHTLTINEMPSHNHKADGWVGSGAGAYLFGSNNDAGTLYEDTLNVKHAGGNQAHNNLQPYEVVNYWKRVA